MEFSQKIYEFLSNTQGFYMNQYYSNFHKENKWIAINRLDEGIYAVIVSDDSSEDVDYDEAFKYLSTLGERFLLNNIVLVNGDYIEDKNINKNKLVYDMKNDEIIHCDESCIPLKNCLEIIKKHNIKKGTINNKKVFDNFKYYPVTSILILINIIVFIITAIASRGILDINTTVLVDFGAKVNYLINKGQVWRFITCAFLHGGIIHIAFNMYSLFVIGTVIERIYGWKKYLGIYLFSSITSSLLGYILDPTTISVGASGAIFGILGAFLWFALKEKEHLQKGVLGNIIAVILLNLYIGLTSQSIDNLGHIGGFLGGFIISIPLYNSKNKF